LLDCKFGILVHKNIAVIGETKLKLSKPYQKDIITNTKFMGILP